MGSWFSKRNTSKDDGGGGSHVVRKQRGKGGEITEKDRAMLELKSARNKVQKYKKIQEIDVEKYKNQTIQLLKAGKRDRALMVLKIKKMKEVQLDKTDAQLINLLQMVESVEFESQQLQVFEGLKAGNSMLKMIHEEMSVEDVQQLMEETAEAQAMADELSSIISGGAWKEEDNDDILAELEAIEAMELEILDVSLPSTLPTTTIESTPATTITTSATDTATGSSEDEVLEVNNIIPTTTSTGIEGNVAVKKKKETKKKKEGRKKVAVAM